MSDPDDTERNDAGFHAAPRSDQDHLYDIQIAAPSHAERARTLAHAAHSALLSTVLHPRADAPGHPYGSLVKVALHGSDPVFLISALAEHTRNLEADARCSLLLTETGDGNPLALGRVTLLGEAQALGRDAGGAGEAYLEVHPQARFYLDFGDFAFWRLEVRALRYIGGFGRMSWVDAGDWAAAEPDPLAGAAAGIIAHMNEDHTDALRDYCLAFSTARDFGAVGMTGVDRYGFEMAVQTAAGARPVRVAFDAPLAHPGQVRGAMVALVKRARARLAQD
jgi:heme iron utilization protein